MTESALTLNDVSISFGGLKAVSGLSLNIAAREIFGLIGPNGAGKTTVFNLLTGIYRPNSGSIKTFGEEITGRAPHEICLSGLARTFQNIRLFKNLTVLENLLIALDRNPSYKGHSLLGGIFKTPGAVALEKAKTDRALEILSMFGLDAKRDLSARNLPYGDQRRLEIARALASGARIILLDEPAAGMSAGETENLMALIKQVRNTFEVTVVLIEHDMHLVMNICERIAVLDYGEKIAEGPPHEIKNNPAVIEAYLGTEEG